MASERQWNEETLWIGVGTHWAFSLSFIPSLPLPLLHLRQAIQHNKAPRVSLSLALALATPTRSNTPVGWGVSLSPEPCVNEDTTGVEVGL